MAGSNRPDRAGVLGRARDGVPGAVRVCGCGRPVGAMPSRSRPVRREVRRPHADPAPSRHDVGCGGRTRALRPEPSRHDVGVRPRVGTAPPERAGRSVRRGAPDRRGPCRAETTTKGDLERRENRGRLAIRPPYGWAILHPSRPDTSREPALAINPPRRAGGRQQPSAPPSRAAHRRHERGRAAVGGPSSPVETPGIEPGSAVACRMASTSVAGALFSSPTRRAGRVAEDQPPSSVSPGRRRRTSPGKPAYLIPEAPRQAGGGRNLTT